MFFVIFIILSLIGYGHFGILPYFLTVDKNDKSLKVNVWTIIIIMTSLATISQGVVASLTDAFAMNSSVRRKTSYGFIRVWGTFGWGTASIILSHINQSDRMPYLVPGMMMLIGLILIDIFMIIAWPDKQDFELNQSPRSKANEVSKITDEPELEGRTSRTEYGTINNTSNIDVDELSPSQSNAQLSSVGTQWSLFKKVVAIRPSILRYMTLFTINGGLIGLQWSYFFKYLSELFTSEKDFTFVSGISMFSQSMLGELPFFILSSHIVKYFGRSRSLSISLATIGFRYLLYQYVLRNSSYYSVLFIEPLAGPNFGLFYVVMTDVGLDYSECDQAIDEVIDERGWNRNDKKLKERLRNSLRATMQSLMGCCYEGLGVGISALLGGMIIDNYDFGHLWVGAAIIAISMSIINISLDFVNCKYLVDQ